MTYNVKYEDNITPDEFEKTCEAADELVKEVNEVLENVYSELEQKYPKADICKVEPSWFDVLKNVGYAETEIYVSGQDEYCKFVIEKVA